MMISVGKAGADLGLTHGPGIPQIATQFSRFTLRMLWAVFSQKGEVGWKTLLRDVWDSEKSWNTICFKMASLVSSSQESGVCP